jgi:DNA-binding NarL/FixJ family response regulator
VDLQGVEVCDPEEGIQVVGVAHDGLEALNQARRLHPDVILMDIKMPGRSGIDVLKEIKSIDPKSLVIMMTPTAPRTPPSRP